MSDPAVPDEVLAHADWQFGPSLLAPGTEFDPTRLVFGAKADTTREAVWVRTQNHPTIVTNREANGWRKCHTKNYWAYYAVPPAVLPPATKRSQWRLKKGDEFPGMWIVTDRVKIQTTEFESSFAIRVRYNVKGHKGSNWYLLPVFLEFFVPFDAAPE